MPSVLSASAPAIINFDSNEDREPSITTVHNGQTHAEIQYAAWMQYDGDPNSTNFHNSVSSNAGGGWSFPVVLQGPRARSGDPMLASNNYVSGLNPQTVYCGATSYNVAPPPSGAFTDNSLLVWHNSGSGWSYDEFDKHTGTNYFDAQGHYIDDRWLDDKPSIAVSQHPNTAGTVYVAYLRNPTNGNQQPQAIGFAMLDDVTQPNPGQWKVRTDVPIASPGQVQCPIVVVDQTSSEPLGSVYVIYLDWAHDGIYVYRTSDKGAS
ncbi:MAG TPA: hypothetical protein VGQ46_08495 [Thermoanaerobaculia bacterium]|jgi:hypothetical protein|nr:hypothetical protein [Thermoanaerobaculia bacterium]